MFGWQVEEILYEFDKESWIVIWPGQIYEGYFIFFGIFSRCQICEESDLGASWVMVNSDSQLSFSKFSPSVSWVIHYNTTKDLTRA